MTGSAARDPAAVRPFPLLAPLLLATSLAGGACAPDPEVPDFPEPDAWGPLAGPGGPSVAYEAEQLWQVCAYLDGGVDDYDHHNLVAMLDGYLVLPWAPEWSGGGVSVFEFDDPCAPAKVGETTNDDIREPHNMGLARVDGRTFAALDYHGGVIDGEITGGVQFWDLSEPTAPAHVADLGLPGYVYPDSYARLSASVFWQGRYVYVSGADNGFWIVDAVDPAAPVFVSQHQLEPPMRVGAVHVVGDVAMVSSFEGARTVLLDVSDPLDPRPIPGGEFEPRGAEGEPREYYFANIGGPWALFARKDGGAGFMAVDISDPGAPRQVITRTHDSGGGGYVARHEDVVFVGEGDGGGGGVYDVSDPADPRELGRIWLTGDLDFLTPVGNVAVASVDEDAEPDRASGVAPWSTEPDRRGPELRWHRPVDGAIRVPTTMRVGLSFDENVDFASVFAGSLRVATADGVPVPGRFSAQETVVSFEPLDAFLPDTTYVVTVPAGGIIDASGNPVAQEESFAFSTGAEVLR